MRPAVFILGDEARFINYKRAVEAAGCLPRFSASPEDAAGCGILLLPGGGDLEPWRYDRPNTASRGLEPARDAAEFALLDRFTAEKKPVLGVCRGHQVINVYFGGTLAQDIPDHSQIDGADRQHPVRTAPSFLSALCGDCSIVNSAHHQAVERLGSGLRAVQWAADGVIEALCHESLPVWGVQWHPERLEVAGERLFRAILRSGG